MTGAEDNRNKKTNGFSLEMTASHAIAPLAMVLIFLVLAACGPSKSGSSTDEASLEPARLTAATLTEQVVLPTGDYLRIPKYANADAELGQRLAMQCRACHTFEAGGPHLNGPNLHGFFGRPVGAAPGYPYSPALAEAEFLWTPSALDAWLAQPAAFLPGNRMAYVGLNDQSDRDAVIAALLKQTSDSQGTRE